MIKVIIPTYRPKDYLYECLSALKAQDIHSEFEVIIVLNGDKESYFLEIATYLEEYKYDNFKLFYTDLKGVSNARNFGLDLVNESDYVVFIDDDDKVSSNYLSGLYKHIQDHSICLSYERTFYDKSSEVLEGYLSSKIKKIKNCPKDSVLIWRSFFSVVWGKMIPMSIIKHHRFNPNFANGEDALFMAAISNGVKTISLSDDDVIYYRRIRELSASQRKRSLSSKFLNSMKLFIEYLKIYFSSPLDYSLLFFLNRFMAIFKVLFVKEF